MIGRVWKKKQETSFGGHGLSGQHLGDLSKPRAYCRFACCVKICRGGTIIRKKHGFPITLVELFARIFANMWYLCNNYVR